MMVGGTAPDFTLYDHTGGLRSLSGFLAEGPVVLFFFPIASSPICTVESCHFRDLGSEFAELGVQRVGVSTDSVDRQARFAARRSFDFPLLADVGGVMSAQYGVRRGVLAATRTRLLSRRDRKGARHVRRRGPIARLLPLRRTTFVIDTDRTVLKVIRSEIRAFSHADQALRFLREREKALAATRPEPATDLPPSDPRAAGLVPTQRGAPESESTRSR
jgi:thioredoxin-dependent peroxiredoxin